MTNFKAKVKKVIIVMISNKAKVIKKKNKKAIMEEREGKAVGCVRVCVHMCKKRERHLQKAQITKQPMDIGLLC